MVSSSEKQDGLLRVDVPARSQITTLLDEPSVRLHPNRVGISTRKKLIAVAMATTFAAGGLFGAIRGTQSDTSIDNQGDKVAANPVAGLILSNASPDSSTKIGVITNQEVLREIKNKYGVTIPNQPSNEYATQDQSTGQLTLNFVPSVEEARVIEDSLSKIPVAGYLSPLIIPYKNNAAGAIEGGSFLGPDWPFMLGSSEYPNLPKNKFITNEPAMELYMPDVPLDTQLPQKTQETTNLPPLEQISFQSVNVKENLQETVPWTTERERLQQTVVHEFAHALQDKIAIANSPSLEAYWNRQAFSLYNENTWDITNPLYTTFAKVTGWKLFSSYEDIKQYDPAEAEKLLKQNPKGSMNDKFWDRDPSIWGDLAHRHGGPTIYSRYGPIQEAWAEYWMTSILYPDLLTPSVNKYFENVRNGLEQNKNDPGVFIQEIVNNPNILLQGLTLVEK